MTTLIENLSTWARERPEAPAVEFLSESLTYADLDRRSAQLAAVLIAGGVTPGARVGIWLRKSIESIVAIYGVLRAGAAYVPIDPSAPLQRVHRIIVDCEVSSVVAHGDQVEWLLEQQRTGGIEHGIIAVGGVPGAPAHPRVHPWQDALTLASGEAALPTVEGSATAYILNTSGSKGAPKGVVLSHRNAVAFVDWAAQEFGLLPTDRLASHAPLHFDLSILDVFAACRVGACVVLIPESHVGFGAALNTFVHSRRVTVWYSVPNALTRMINAKNNHLLAESALRVVLFAGETFPIEYLRRVSALVGSAGLYNLYGPTETNVCTFHRVRKRDLAAGRTEPVPIGKPCPYAQAFLLDPTGNLLEEKLDQYGELCIAGDSVMAGYWRDSELTAAKTTQVTTDAGTVTVYRTGDMVRLDADLNYVFCGRDDDMVKIRGYRVELGEIESVLAAIDGVQEVTCVAVRDGDSVERIEAFLVSSTGDLAAIRQRCLSALPRYMVPAHFHIVDALHRTASGKIDRRALVGR